MEDSPLLGVRTPVALPYLIAEGLLPEKNRNDLYSCHIYTPQAGHGDVEDELVATRSCVVWSQGGVVRNVYRFELEGEEVIQALLTHFPSSRVAAHTGESVVHDASEINSGYGKSSRKRSANSVEQASYLERAVVVILKTKAHIYFLNGSNHIVDLPFEVSEAFAAPRGLLLQRQTSTRPSLPATPQLPPPPPNSFFSSQLHPSSSYLQSPTLAKSYGGPQPFRPSPLGGNARLDPLFQHVFATADADAEVDAACLYSMTSPLSDLGVVTYSIQHHRPRVYSKGRSGVTVEFEALDAAERIIYVSNCDELESEEHVKRGSLTLLVTANDETHTLTVWQAWYIDERSLVSLLKQRAAHKVAKTKRRSSFMAANVVTGTSTPAVRAREGARESFVAAGSMRIQGDAYNLNASTSSRRPTRQEEEADMAHQMDPDFQSTASQQPARESRRISSLNADTRGGQYANASFAGPGGRRNISFGGPGERRSVGHRKSRGSTPGSVFSRCLGPEDDFMELDSSFDVDNEENIEAIARHIRATHDAAGADGVFGGIDDNFKRELVVQKIHSLAMSFTTSREAKPVPFQVITLKDPMQSRPVDNQLLGVFLRNRVTTELICLQINVKQRRLWLGVDDETEIAVPIFANEVRLGQCGTMTKVKDGSVNALLCSAGIILSPAATSICPVQAPLPLTAQNALHAGRSDIRQDSRKVPVPGSASRSAHYIHPEEDRRHNDTAKISIHRSPRLPLRPVDITVNHLLQVCELVLPERQAQCLRGVWLLAHTSLLQQPERLSVTAVKAEMVAFASVIFVLTGHFMDREARTALTQLSMASNNTVSNFALAAIRHQHRVKHHNEDGPWQRLTSPHRRSIPTASPTPMQPDKADQADQCLLLAAHVAEDLVQTVPWLTASGSMGVSANEGGYLLLALHVFSQERKLCLLSSSSRHGVFLAALLAQVGGLLGLRGWSCATGEYLNLEGAREQDWAFVRSTSSATLQLPLMDEPVSVFMWFEHAMRHRSTERYPSLSDIASLSRGQQGISDGHAAAATNITPRIASLSDMLSSTSAFTISAAKILELMAVHGVDLEVLETLPSAIAAPFEEAIARSESEPPTAWPSHLLRIVGRDDIDLEQPSTHPSARSPGNNSPAAGVRDVHTICGILDQQSHNSKTREASRHAVSQLIFSEDRRIIEATGLMQFSSPQVAECAKQPDWSDAHHFEQQRRVLQWVTTRMIALPSGDGMLHFDSQTPLLTERYLLSGFSNACVMQPMGHTLTADRSGLTEEKVNWAYFHAGVSAGLRISKHAKGIDTSWIAFNKPNDLTNRHAGLLLALGLRGHLRHLAKWLSFKYLTPKHTVTSVGLLLGLSASYMGTMDGLITRMLSVHITRMLPLGAAELNVSPITQTAGLMGIGLLYYNTQHRRMSEIMLSEIEHMELEDPDSGPDPLRDESYRLAAGFALGFINLGKGGDLRGLSGMYLPERLLAIAVGSRPVSAVHVFDRATAGAVMGLALVYMKSGDRSIARKIDIPDTEAQYDQVRPDILMLRAMARHIILWDNIITSKSDDGLPSFTQRNLPPCYQKRFEAIAATRTSLKSSDVPFFNIVTGLVLALSLKYAGSGDEIARDEILVVLDYFYKAKGSADASFYYDAKLTRATVRRCIDVVALAAATVMAGTGDIKTFRYLRRLHGRLDPETPYGSHLAAHLAIGVLFLGDGTHTFGTSNLAVASLLCSFYPLFPTDVHDNHVHLQAFRHLWVFAAEARCLIIEDIDTQRPIPMPITVAMRDGSIKNLTSPCLLPELSSISTVQSDDPSYWRVTLDFANNPKHLARFTESQRISVRRCPPSEAHHTTFTATMAALDDVHLPPQAGPTSWQSIFDLPGFHDIDKAETELILPPNPQSSINTNEQSTSVDDRLVLHRAVEGGDRDALWNLRMLFAWVEKSRECGYGRSRWMSDEVLDALKARVEERMQRMGTID